MPSEMESDPVTGRDLEREREIGETERAIEHTQWFLAALSEPDERSRRFVQKMLDELEIKLKFLLDDANFSSARESLNPILP
jgi:hypothetical protein